jgi:hypothetical protein
MILPMEHRAFGFTETAQIFTGNQQAASTRVVSVREARVLFKA